MYISVGNSITSVTCSWNGAILRRLQKFSHLLRTVAYQILVVFLHDANMTVYADWENLCILMYPSTSEKPLVPVVDIGVVFGLFLVIVNNCCWWWFVLLLKVWLLLETRFLLARKVLLGLCLLIPFWCWSILTKWG